MNYIYDYCIVGGGPSGLICSYYLSNKGYKVLLLESSASLGGCHKVLKNKDGLHLEHSPRIYPTSFINFFNFIEKELNIKKNESFVSYKFQMYSKDSIKYFIKMGILDMSKLYYTYLKYNVVKMSLSTKYTVLDYVTEYKFNDNSIIILNNICNLIDGGDIDKTLLKTFLNAIDGLGLYKILQPNLPMNELIFNKLKTKLIKNKVDIYLNKKVINIIKKSKEFQVITNEDKYLCNKLILAIPPISINKINNAVKLLEYDEIDFNKWSNYSLYKDYISFSFEFSEKFNITRDIPDSISKHPWGEIFIDYGNYFKNQKGSMIVITISNLDEIDPLTQKTANQMGKIELINRVKDILKERLKINNEPVKSDMYSEIKRINNKWIQENKPFLLTDQGILKPNKYSKNIYTTGHHTGYSHHPFNTIESAIINAYVLLNSIENMNLKIMISTPLSNFIIMAIFIILLIHILLISPESN